jgi:hypothetical protein
MEKSIRTAFQRSQFLSQSRVKTDVKQSIEVSSLYSNALSPADHHFLTVKRDTRLLNLPPCTATQSRRLGQGWRTFLRTRAQIVDNFWRNSLACPRDLLSRKMPYWSLASSC